MGRVAERDRSALGPSPGRLGARPIAVAARPIAGAASGTPPGVLASLAASLVLAYAAALRAFDPELDGAQAARLAARVVAEADAMHLDARLVVALVAVESSWRPDAVSRAGARGLGQLMPATAAALGVDPDDADANLHGAVVHFAALLGRYRARPPAERYARAIAAYNAGAAAVERYGGVPPYAETRLEVRRVLDLWRRLAVR